MRINHITPKNYNVVTAFNKNYYEYRNMSWQPGECDMDVKPLPNAPMAARHTLLAERLRKGTYATNGRRQNCSYDNDQPIRTISPLKCAAFTGKMLGVEIEYYPKAGCHIKNNTLTEIGNDGSLREGGREIRRLTWASKSGRLEGLLNLKLVGTIDKSCGLHVHVDARHLDKDGLLSPEQTYDRLTELYPMLKKLVPRSRLRNTYCKWTNNRASGNRYAAINFCSFSSHKTIEFRCQGGSVSVIKIESWALLCQYLVNFCANPANTVPARWSDFIAILPEPLRSWCILRKEKLYGNCPQLNERTMSAIND